MRLHTGPCSAALAAIVVLAVGCTEDLRIGGTCTYNSDCPSGLVCGFGRCRAECRERVDCPSGESCLIDPESGLGTCSTDGDRCEASDQCSDGLSCALGRCANTCRGDDDCAPGDRCWSIAALESAFCVDPGQQPEAGTPVSGGDGGAGDASAGDASLVDATLGDAGDGGTRCVGPDCDPVRHVAMGWQHVCAVTESGRILCWGRDVAAESSGAARPAMPECGVEYCRTRPVEVPRLAQVPGGSPLAAVDVALGEAYSCALLVDGSVQCWGTNRPAPPALSPTPAFVERAPDEGPIRDALSLRAGRAHLYIELADGLFGAGSEREGELAGAGESPMAVRIGDRPEHHGAGAFFGCAVRGGVVSCWGSNRYRQLGRDEPAPALGAFDPVARPVDGLTIGSAVGLVVGGQHACAHDATGAIECWGQARDRTDVYVAPAIVLRGGVVLRDLSSASSADAQVTCARSDTVPSRAYCWGRAGDAQFYPPGTLDTTRAVAMWADALGDVSQVATDGTTACAVAEGDLLCWGSNSAGQLGQGDDAVHDGPVRPRW